MGSGVAVAWEGWGGRDAKTVPELGMEMGWGMETGGGRYVPRLRLQVFRRVAAELTGDPNF